MAKKVMVALRKFRANGRPTDVDGRLLRLWTANYRPGLTKAKQNGIIG
jgi:hypothetical protein